MAQKKATKSKASTSTQISNELIIAQVFCVLYVAVSFVPLLGAVDYDAPQWLYISLVNLVCLFFLYKHKEFFQLFQFAKKTRVYLGLLTAFFAVGCLSMFFAINLSESLVHLSRFFNVIIAFFCLFLCIRKQPMLFFRLICKISLLVVFYQSWYAIDYFIGNSSIARSAEFVSNFKHPFSNTNIYTAFIAVQIPLLIYAFFYFKNFWKYAAGVAVFVGTLAVLLAGSRTAVLSVGVIYVVYLAFFIIGFTKSSITQKNTKEIIVLLAMPLAIVFLVLNVNRVEKSKMNSLSTVLNSKNIDFYEGKKAMKAISESDDATLVAIELPSRISSGRFSQWQLAFKHFKEHPLLGVGYGNYKVVKKKSYYDQFTHNKGTFVNPRRAHNDFIEKLAETGIIGFLLYILLFIFPLIWLLQLMKREKNRDAQFVYLSIFLVATAYTIDALLNFPLERPPVQLFFVLAVCFVLAFARKNAKVSPLVSSSSIKLASMCVIFLLTTASIASNYLVLKSYQLQQEMRTDLAGKSLFDDAPFKKNYAQIQKQWINYPQLSHVGTANKVYLANYTLKAKKYDEALQILNEAQTYTGDAHLAKSLKAEIFSTVKNNPDSAQFYAEQVFAEYPAFKANYMILKNSYEAQKDTVNLWRVMHRYTTKNYRDVNGWIVKANTIYEFTNDSKRMQKILDSGMAYNVYSKRILDAKKDIDSKLNFKSYLSKTEIKEKHQEAYDFFIKQQYVEARAIFEEILKTNPKDYLSIQNIGIIDLIEKKYEAAIKRLSVVINVNAFSDGKAEYSRGYSYEQLGNIEKAKADYRRSRAKNYPQALQLPASKYE